MAATEPGEARVLVVDDDSDLRESLVELLRDAGFSAVAAANGTEALDMLLKSQPRPVLADLTMPGLDGTSLMREAQSMMEAAPVFIFVTAALPSTVGDVGAPVVTKPVDIDQLLKIVSEHCAN